ncbi:MAG TPA: tlde1 domain-containing protein [Vineibacter sp.]|nr:tlde1 domain-containing protein [Vineibacter sp.]
MSYEWEKGDPATEQCACMSGTCTGKLVKLHFDGWYLRTFVGETVDSAQHARSGLPVGDEFDYSAARQQAADAGPIPEGNYWIVPSDLGSPRAFSAGWGHYRITIRHYPNTATHGRGGFFVHGGSKFGSKGCIDLAGFMDTFVRRLNELVPAKVLNVPQRVVVKPTCYVPLVVKYSSPRADMPPWFNT